MKWKNKKARIILMINGETLTFTGLITDETITHITFLDKYKKQYEYKKEYIEYICEVTE